MIELTVMGVLGLHQRDRVKRAAVVEELRRQLRGRLVARDYEVWYEVHGRFRTRGGRRRRRDGDNVAYWMSNALKEASGVDDSHLTCNYHVRVVESDREFVRIRLL